MEKVYVLVDCDWEDISDSGSETERNLGVFSSSELATKAANDYLKNTDWGGEEEYITIPETPITFEQLKDGYEYFDHTNYFGASLRVYIYELDKLL